MVQPGGGARKFEGKDLCDPLKMGAGKKERPEQVFCAYAAKVRLGDWIRRSRGRHEYL